MLHDRKLRWGCASIFILAIAYACTLPSPRSEGAAAAATSNNPNVLIYCDGSQGTFGEAGAIQDLVQLQGGQCTFATSDQQFTEKLSQPGWTAVHVLAKKSQSEPAFAAALRTYAGAHPDVGISLFIWKAHSPPPAANEAVLATTGLVTWWGDRTSVTYALAKSAPHTAVSDGLSFPSFVGVETDSHALLFNLPEESDCAAAAATFPPVDMTLCKKKCYEDVYVSRIDVCWSDFDAELEICDSLHGPPPGGGIGDPEELEACRLRYTGFWNQCRAHALQRYKDCVSQCATQPAQ